MFQITEETRNTAIAEMKSILIECFEKSLLESDNDLVNQTVGEAFDAAVAVVKKQFGM